MVSIFSEMLDLWVAAGQPPVAWESLTFSLNEQGMARYLDEAVHIAGPLKRVLAVKIVYVPEQTPDVLLHTLPN